MKTINNIKALDRTDVNSVEYIVIHHTAATNQNKQLNSVNSFHKSKWGILSSLGFYTAYNVFIDSDGKRTQTRAAGEETIAQKGFNGHIKAIEFPDGKRFTYPEYYIQEDFVKQEYKITNRTTKKRIDTVYKRANATKVERGRIGFAICLSGNFNEEMPTAAQVTALKKEVTDAQQAFPRAQIIFHGELPGNSTSCAGSGLTHDYLNKYVMGNTDENTDDQKEKGEFIDGLNEKLAALERIVDQLVTLLTKLTEALKVLK